MSLIYFLETLEPLPPSGSKERPNPVQERDYESWADYFTRTTADFAGHQLCDCWRHPVSGRRMPCTWAHLALCRVHSPRAALLLLPPTCSSAA